MVNDPFRPASPDRHVQGIDHQLGPQVGGHRPAHHAAAEGIDHYGQIQKPRPGPDIGDIGNPELVRPVRRKVPIHQIRGSARPWLPMRRRSSPASAHPFHSRLFHQTRYPLAGNPLALSHQFGSDPRRSIGASTPAMYSLDSGSQLRILLSSSRGGTITPRVVPTGGNAQHLAHRDEGIVLLVLAHELEDFPGTEPVSRANQAVAFARISRSSFSCRFSRRSWPSSSRSVLVNPSARRPSSKSACLTQLRIDCAVGSNSRPRSSGALPARTSSTIRARYSGGYEY